MNKFNIMVYFKGADDFCYYIETDQTMDEIVEEIGRAWKKDGIVKINYTEGKDKMIAVWDSKVVIGIDIRDVGNNERKEKEKKVIEEIRDKIW